MTTTARTVTAPRAAWPGALRLLAVGVLALAAATALRPAQAQESATLPPPDAAAPLKKDVPYVPTPDEVVDTMLKAAAVRKGDVVYDLGCGDGRIAIAAAKRGARAVGIDIDPERIEESRKNARRAGVANRTEFRVEDLFRAEIGEATVVTLYLLPTVNRRLMPKLLAELKPGTRVVSHAFDMGDWRPERTIEVDGTRVYLWTVPARTAGAAGTTGAGGATPRG
jgi:precorrin-6B methylase 2